MLKITDAILVLPDRTERADLYIEGGKIAAIGGELPADEVLSAGGRYVSPGFIDTHVHGGGGADFMDGGVEPMRRAAHAHLVHGTTGICPTTLSCAYPVLREAVADYLEFEKESGQGGVPHLLGMHLEGPYFSPKQAGAQPPEYIYPPKKEEYEEILAMAPGRIRKWSFAPELPGCEEFLLALCAAGVTPGVGHTDAVASDVAFAHSHGAKYLTHFYSAMSTITRVGGYRVLGAVEAGYLLDDMWAEIIADGDHLPPDLLKLIFKCKRHDRIHLVTDSMRGAGMPEGESLLGRLGEGVPCIIEGGVAKMPDRSCFAGSVSTSDRCVRTVWKRAGLPLCEAVAMMSRNVADLYGFTGKGSIEVGKDADLVFFDDNVNVERVLLLGKTAYCKE